MKPIFVLLGFLLIFALLSCNSESDSSYEFSLTDTFNNKVRLTDLTSTSESVAIVFFRGHF